MDAEDLATTAFVGHADDDLAVEPARTTQRFIDRLGTIGRRDHDEVRARFNTVHQRQQLRDETLLRLARHLATLGCDRIDLVDEDDRRRCLRRLLEDLAEARLGLAIGRAHDLGAVDQEELRIRFVGDGAREPRLAGAGRAMQ